VACPGPGLSAVGSLVRTRIALRSRRGQTSPRGNRMPNHTDGVLRGRYTSVCSAYPLVMRRVRVSSAGGWLVRLGSRGGWMIGPSPIRAGSEKVRGKNPSLQTRTDPVRADSQHARKPAQLNGSPQLPYYFRDSRGALVVGGFYLSDPDRLPLYVWGFTSITRRLWIRPSDGSAQALAIGLAGARGLVGRLGARGGFGVL